jgi:two-component system, OmpR family, sensor histidine kinase KdpD
MFGSECFPSTVGSESAVNRLKHQGDARARRAGRDTFWHLGAATLAVAVITALIHLIPGASHTTNITLLYLLAVIGAAVRFGRAAAVAVSLLSFLTFDFFFTLPYHTFAVHDPAEWLALCMFLLIATVTGQLTALLRAHANEARQREREAEALAEASWAVASQVDRGCALNEVLRRLSNVVTLKAAAIVILEADQPTSIAQFAGAWLHDAAGRALPRFDDGPAGEAVRFVLEQGRSIGWEGYGHHGCQRVSGGEDADAIYLPLTAESRVLGVLYLQTLEERPLTPPQRRVVASLANHAAVVLERDRLTRAQTKAEALAEADRLKTALLAMVSHDFRSPLASIKASATALLEDGTPVDAETQRELLTGIDHEADRLNRVVGNILALSRLEADAWRPQSEAIHPTELVGSTLQAFGPDQNQRIQVQLAAALTEVYLDPVQIVQVLHNLLDNALKYSAPDSPVELRVDQDEAELRVEVLDRGLGLPPGEEARIFERFYRSRAYARAPCQEWGSGWRFVADSWRRMAGA